MAAYKNGYGRHEPVGSNPHPGIHISFKSIGPVFWLAIFLIR